MLLELFTSEGCSSCPTADRLLEFLDEKQPIAGADLIVLSEHVDYWDRLGWKDPFSSSEFTAGQQNYTNRFHLDGVYTPQLLVDGLLGLVGSDGREASSAIQKAIREQKIPIEISNVSLDGNQVRAHIAVRANQSFGGGRAALYIAIADNWAESRVARGENAARSLSHVAVTRVLQHVGDIDLEGTSVKDVSLSFQPDGKGSQLVAFIRDHRSGHFLGAAAQKF